MAGLDANLESVFQREKLSDSGVGGTVNTFMSILQKAGRLLKSVTETSIKQRWTPYKKAVFCIEIALIIHYLA